MVKTQRPPSRAVSTIFFALTLEILAIQAAMIMPSDDSSFALSARSTPSQMRPWYSNPSIGRDRSEVMDEGSLEQMLSNESSSTKFILMSKAGMLHKSISVEGQRETEVQPLYLSKSQLLDEHISKEANILSIQKLCTSTDSKQFASWVGSHDGKNYFVVRLEKDDLIMKGERQDMKPLREFGDRLASSVDAGILATANGLVEFHKSHGFCSSCGGETMIAKVGACRRCLDCKRSVYPRLDVATIMLVTSPCNQYALLGRKAAWPSGRYSTLAGFTEVGETLEECLIRETYEESGVHVDPSSVIFVASQPWPFPRSLMVGFSARATKPAEDKSDDEGGLPKITIEEEMEDIQWFSKDYVKKRLDGGSTALGYKPSREEAEFHIPGRSSLARILITQWAESQD